MQDNIKNRTVFCRDNIDILQGINSNSIDLIYLDPPFNKKKTFTASIGSSAEGASFSDIFREEDVKDEWLQTIQEDMADIDHLLTSVKHIEGRTSYNFCYLAYMAIRLIECQRILKDTGSLYLHCDPTMSHYLKLLLDCIFGEKNFQNEIIWSYRTGGSTDSKFSKKHDIILFYSKTDDYHFNIIKEKAYTKSKSRKAGTVNYGAGTAEFYEDDDGVYNMVNMRDVWDVPYINSQAKERTGYPTQKPIALLERIISASSNVGDIVLDPFCGCATTCVVAEKLQRQWVGIDVSQKAYDLVRIRLANEVEWEGSLFQENLVTFTTTAPHCTDSGQDDRDKKYVYIISHPNYPSEYKVGIAKNVTHRLNSYQTSDPNRDYKEEYRFLTPHFRAIESYIHQKYDNKHEWVQGSLADIKADIEAYQPV